MWTATFVLAGLIVAVLLITRPHTRPMVLRGAVIRQDADPTKELPLADVEISALSNGTVIGEGKSDASGSFTVNLRTRIWIGRAVLLKLRHADYEPLDLKEFVGDKLYVAHMVPLPHDVNVGNRPSVVVSNVWPAIRSRPPTRPTWAARSRPSRLRTRATCRARKTLRVRPTGNGRRR